MKCGRIALLLLAAAPIVNAHPLAPALLELREIGADRYEMLWRTSVARVQRVDVAPRLPAGCEALGTPVVAIEGGEALVARSQVRCSTPLAGATLAIDGLDRSGINVIVRIEDRQGQTIDALLDASRPQFVVPPFAAPPAVFRDYLALGVTHLFGGLDHVLFIAGLLLLVRGARRLVATITAFTVGHSITLAAATLGVVHVSPPLMELGIALSIFVLACEAARPAAVAPSPLLRRPWLMAAGFGLLHGLGFAGALADAGLPADEVALALLAFNLGIEAGQLALVAALLAAAALLHGIAPAAPKAWVRLAPGHVMGALAAFWCFERGAALV